ncbi:MAG: lipid A biosynthesis acyltransferase [Ferruginibacter sp.]
MYYLVYGIFYLISLLPFFILYGISDFFFLLMYYVIGYRKKVVMGNLAIAFPEKTIAQRRQIARKFYRHFIDTFIESIKMISMSDKAFTKRCTIDLEDAFRLAAMGKNIQFHCGHQMNWEYINWILGRDMTVIPFVGVYKSIGSKVFDRLFYKIRSRYKTILVSTADFRSRMHGVFKSQYSIALAADQNPWNLDNAYWLYFFGKKTPFINGPDKGAIRNNTSVIFMSLERKRRGYYHLNTKTVTENGAEMKKGELTRIYRDMLEDTIRKDPSNYLWTHKRWKHTFNETNEIFKRNWIDIEQ